MIGTKNRKTTGGPQPNLVWAMSPQEYSDQLGMVRSLKEVIRLQKLAMEAQIDAREKRREAGFKRRDVWTRDAVFMKELQRLVAQERLAEFSELFKLAGECQVARNELGPLEEQGVRAEQRLEGEIWKLQKAEEKLNDVFHDELQATDNLSTPSSSDSSVDSSISESESESEGLQPTGTGRIQLPRFAMPLAATEPFLASINQEPSQEILLSGIHDHSFESDEAEKDPSNWDADSGVGEIDQTLDTWTKTDLVGRKISLPDTSSRSISRYPELLVDFRTRRDQINQWLLQTLLLSHHEVNILVDQLKREINPVPSNWSQLVIAYWELDEVATPVNRQLHSAGHASQVNTSLRSGVREWQPSRRLNNKDIHLDDGMRNLNDGRRTQSLITLKSAPSPRQHTPYYHIDTPSLDMPKSHEPP